MSRRRRLLAMLPALLPAWLLPAAPPSAAAPVDALRVVAADLPPYAVAQGGASPGLLVELVQDLARRLGTPVTVEFYPWQRALTMATVLPRIAVMPVTRTPERETLFRWLVKLHQQNFVFVALHGGVDVRDLTLLRRQRLVVLRGSPHKRVLQELDFIDVAECSTVRECMRMVKKGIADATYGGEDVHRNAAGADGNREAEFDFSPVFRSGDIWLAGSLDFSEDDGRKWRAALESARADGTLARILRKYGLAGN
ncbi:substrate-binding periplasmic protein [Rugamonas rivuli]|uniref:Transporter substrate-binding domain-containing protein n=1 Tax=Rugamonas rivuli TaxID=2743358 RepID=A0A843SK57_9BURK|nr:transporter substrate-binding domain-containing protein [Rugamonas rivuli]MQA22848.1 transporter substrate-binding domain-containing protein [Rugamonas rivuli]